MDNQADLERLHKVLIATGYSEEDAAAIIKNVKAAEAKRKKGMNDG